MPLPVASSEVHDRREEDRAALSRSVWRSPPEVEVDDVVDGGVAARLRCKEVEGRGVDGAREDCGSNAVAVFAMAVFDDEEDEDSPMDRRVLRTKRLLPGRSRSRSITLWGRGSGVDLPFPLPVPRRVAVDEEDTFREGKSWIWTLSPASTAERRP